MSNNTHAYNVHVVDYHFTAGSVAMAQRTANRLLNRTRAKALIKANGELFRCSINNNQWVARHTCDASHATREIATHALLTDRVKAMLPRPRISQAASVAEFRKVKFVEDCILVELGEHAL